MSERDRIKNFILQNYLFTDDPRALADDASLIDEGVIDSTGILELMMYLEESLSVKVNESEVTPANFGSIDAITAFVARKRQG